MCFQQTTFVFVSVLSESSYTNFILRLSLLTLFYIIAIAGSVAAFPIRGRQAPQSPSFSTLSSPRLSPYYVYFGNLSVTMADAFDSLNMRSVTIGFASAQDGVSDGFGDV